jgi:hypothetical protein
MGEGSERLGQGGKHHVDDELAAIAGDVARSVRLSRADRLTRDDCISIAYLAGARAKETAAAAGKKTSRKILFNRMRDRVMRELTRKKELREADVA